MTRTRRVQALTCIAIAGRLVLAQSDTAQISGYIRDASASGVPGAKIAISNEATALERRTAANESGYYVVTGLPPGFYTITVEAPGFKLYTKTRNKLDPDIGATVDASLEIGAVTERVEVVAASTALQTDSATVGRLVDGEQVRAAVLNGRNPLLLTLLKPGVTAPGSSALNTFAFGLGAGLFNVNGGRATDMMITFDGAPARRTRANSAPVGVADLESVQEMQVLTANYNAEYGRSAGGQVRIVTRSGGKDFHGGAYEYFRNCELDANTWLRNRTGLPREARKFNQFGYVLSGPVYLGNKWNRDRNKLFFLWSEEWLRMRREFTASTTVPSMAMRRGDFSELLDPANPFFRRIQVINDPNTGAPFANNVIPAGRLSAVGLAMLRVYPEPTPGYLQGTNNYILTRPQPEDQRKDTMAVDFLPTPKHTLRFRHQDYQYKMLSAFYNGSAIAPPVFDRPNQTTSLHYTLVAGPSTINEFLATASVDRVRYGPANGSPIERSRYGIDYPYLFPERKQMYDRLPTVTIANFQQISTSSMSRSAGPIYVIADTMTKIAGPHTIKWGALFERSGENDFDQPSSPGSAVAPGIAENGSFTFQDTRTGASTTDLAIANAAMGLFSGYAEAGQRAYTPYRGQMFEAFAQDSWRATPKLFVEAGLRYTLQQPYYHSLWGNISVFDPRRYDPAKAVPQNRATGFLLPGGDRFNGVVIPGTGFPDAARGRVAIADSGELNRLFSGGSNTWGELQKLNLQPRIGVAYRIGAGTAIRSGFGRFYARPGVSDSVALGANPPFQPSANITNGQADNPGATGAAAPIAPAPFMTTDPIFKIPSAYTWSATVERLIGAGTSVSIAYVGRTGVHLQRQRNLNQLPLGTTYRPENKNVNVDVLRPFKGYAAIALMENAARSKYNALQIEVTRRFTKDLGYGFAYTYARSMDNASDPRDTVYDAYNDRSYWGPSNFDVRHTAVFNVIYELPLARHSAGLRGKLLAGWRITAVAQFQTGNPITVGNNEDFAGIGSFNALPWEVRGDPALPRSERKFADAGAYQNFYFRTKNADGSDIFTPPAQGTFSATQTRNSLPIYNVGFQNWNLAAFKSFSIAEKQTIQLRAELYNWLNHPNWGPVDVNPRSGTFGRVYTKASERNVQVALRYSF